MIYSLENEYLKIDIEDKGAQLQSVKSKKSGVEYLWQGDEKYWTGRAPVLFPICGRLYGGKYTYLGKEYKMDIHGFIKDSSLTVVENTEKSVTFLLSANEDTKAIYPFLFEFYVEYCLNGNRLDVKYIIKNTGDNDIPFSFGYHAGFNVPFNHGEKFDDYYLEFDKNEQEKIVLSDDLLYTDKRETVLLTDKKLPLKHELFDNDGIFFEANSGVVKLKSVKNDNFIEVSFSDMTAVGFWHTAKTDAPFICIEPWHGVPSYSGKTDDFSDKKCTLKLKKGKTYQNHISIFIRENQKV